MAAHRRGGDVELDQHQQGALRAAAVTELLQENEALGSRRGRWGRHGRHADVRRSRHAARQRFLTVDEVDDVDEGLPQQRDNLKVGAQILIRTLHTCGP
jgi:hypothetical protein